MMPGDYMDDEPKTFIKDIDELREFIKMNKRKQDYFDSVVKKAISKRLNSAR